MYLKSQYEILVNLGLKDIILVETFDSITSKLKIEIIVTQLSINKF